MTKNTGQLFKDTLLGWLVGANIPFSGIEHPLFRQLLCLLNKDLLQELLPYSGNTTRAWMKAKFEAEKELLKQANDRFIKRYVCVCACSKKFPHNGLQLLSNLCT